MLSFVRTVVLVCLGLSLLSGTWVSGTRLNADMWVTSQHGHASGTRSNAVPRTPAARGWQLFIYGGVSVPSGIGRAPAPSGYSLAYPPAWSSKLWPDSLATYGQLDVQSPGGTGISLVLLPLRPHGPTLSAIIARDKAVLSNTRQDSVPLPLGPALRIAGRHKPATSGLMTQILYLERRQVVYRLFATRPMGATGPNLLLQIAATLRLTDNHGPSSPSRPPVPQPGAGTCCHCPAWGAGWGVPLTSLDGVTAYGNGGTTDAGRTWVELLVRHVTLATTPRLETNIIVTSANRQDLIYRHAYKALALAIDPQDPRRLYAGTDGLGVLRSANGGVTWQYNPRSPSVAAHTAESLVIDPQRPMTVYALIQDTTIATLYRSDDGGSAWQPVWHGGWTNSLLLERGVLSVAHRDGVYASSDRGAHWRRALSLQTITGFATQTPFGPAGMLVQARHDRRTGGWQAVVVISSRTTVDQGIYLTTDQGATWRRQSIGAGQALTLALRDMALRTRVTVEQRLMLSSASGPGSWWS